jgi:hypothetical protein
VIVPAGTFTNCIRISVTGSIGTNRTPREMTYAFGVGLVSDRSVLHLTSFADPNIVTGAPVLSIQDAVLLTWPLADNSFILQGSSNLLNWAPILPNPVPLDGQHQIAVPRDRTQDYFRLGAR